MLGNDDIRRFGIVFEFLPEVLYMNPQQVAGVDIGISPNLSQQAFMGQYTPFVPDQVVEQLPLR